MGRGPVFGLLLWLLDVSDDEARPVFVTGRLNVASPDGRYLAYPERKTGLAVIEERQSGRQWTLDLNGSLVNFAPDGRHILASHHFFYSFDVSTGESRQLTDSSQPLRQLPIMDWRISPDGRRIVLLATNGAVLNGLWLVEIEKRHPCAGRTTFGVPLLPGAIRPSFISAEMSARESCRAGAIILLS